MRRQLTSTYDQVKDVANLVIFLRRFSLGTRLLIFYFLKGVGPRQGLANSKGGVDVGMPH